MGTTLVDLEPRTLGKRALLAALLHLGLLALWPLVGLAYAQAYRELAQLGLAMIDPLPGKIDVLFEPGSGGLLAKDLVLMDTEVQLLPRGVGAEPATFGASSFFHGYYPTTVLLAIFAAAELSWRARRKPLLWALLLLHLGLLVRCLPAVYWCYAQCTIDGRPALALGTAGLRTLHLLRNATWVEVFPNYLVPLLLFALCVFGPHSSAKPRASFGRT